MLADMTKRLTQHQNEVCAILARLEQNFKMNKDVSVTAPNYNIPKAKLANSIGLGMSYPDPQNIPATLTTEEHKTNTSVVIVEPNRAIGIVQATSNANSTTKPALVKACYVNWDFKHEQLKYLRLVNFKKLSDIIKRYTFQTLTTAPVHLTIVDVINARREITALNASMVTRFKRFPSSGDFIDINLTSERNSQLKKMMTTMGLVSFAEAARDYAIENIFRRDNVMDQRVFEIRYGLDWALLTFHHDIAYPNL